MSEIMSAEDFADKMISFVDASFWKRNGRRKTIKEIKSRDIAIRNAALEEAAKICELQMFNNCNEALHYREVFADEIRALKTEVK